MCFRNTFVLHNKYAKAGVVQRLKMFELTVRPQCLRQGDLSIYSHQYTTRIMLELIYLLHANSYNPYYGLYRFPLVYSLVKNITFIYYL